MIESEIGPNFNIANDSPRPWGVMSLNYDSVDPTAVAITLSQRIDVEKGHCCCKCWRWYVYGGLGKYLIKNHGSTGEQITRVWNLSDGGGGDSEHYHD